MIHQVLNMVPLFVEIVLAEWTTQAWSISSQDGRELLLVSGGTPKACDGVVPSLVPFLAILPHLLVVWPAAEEDSFHVRHTYTLSRLRMRYLPGSSRFRPVAPLVCQRCPGGRYVVYNCRIQMPMHNLPSWR